MVATDTNADSIADFVANAMLSIPAAVGVGYAIPAVYNFLTEQYMQGISQGIIATTGFTISLFVFAMKKNFENLEEETEAVKKSIRDRTKTCGVFRESVLALENSVTESNKYFENSIETFKKSIYNNNYHTLDKKFWI